MKIFVIIAFLGIALAEGNFTWCLIISNSLYVRLKH